nr:helicase [Marseillevirus sp.]
MKRKTEMFFESFISFQEFGKRKSEMSCSEIKKVLSLCPIKYIFVDKIYALFVARLHQEPVRFFEIEQIVRHVSLVFFAAVEEMSRSFRKSVLGRKMEDVPCAKRLVRFLAMEILVHHLFLVHGERIFMFVVTKNLFHCFVLCVRIGTSVFVVPYSAGVAGAHSSAQMLGRVRDLAKREMSVFVKQIHSNAPIKREELIRRIEMREEASYRACGLTFDRTFGILLPTPFSELYISNKLRNNRSKRNFLEELRVLLESQGITIVEQKNGHRDNELDREIHEAGREVVLGNFENIENAKEISFCEYIQISESRETTPQQRMSCQKFLVSQHFCLPSQEFVTVNFLKNYGKMRVAYDSLCLTFGEEKKVRQRMKGLILDDIERRKRLPQQLLVRERYFHEKVFYIWKLLNVLGFAQWWEEKTAYKDKFEPLFKRVYGIISKRQERFKSLFSSLPKDEKDAFRWFNDQLRKVFGFWFGKKKGNKGDYRCTLVFGALWDTGTSDFKVPFFVPKIGH